MKTNGVTLDNSLDVQCPWCGASNKLKDWDDYTYSHCTNREMKRAYTHLNNSKAFKRSSDTFYICKCCNKWARGSQLSIINTDDKFLRSLGGESVFIIENKDNGSNDNA